MRRVVSEVQEERLRCMTLYEFDGTLIEFIGEVGVLRLRLFRHAVIGVQDVAMVAAVVRPVKHRHLLKAPRHGSIALAKARVPFADHNRWRQRHRQSSSHRFLDASAEVPCST